MLYFCKDTWCTECNGKVKKKPKEVHLRLLKKELCRIILLALILMDTYQKNNWLLYIKIN